MFASRLAEANTQAKTEHKQITPVKAREHNEKIVHEMAEYLFDIFDANLMEEYHMMESFEMKAVDLFMKRENANDEYTFEQEECHKEFLVLFETLLEGFLVKKNITIDALLEEVKWYKKQDHVEANEIIEVIDSFSSFPKWANHMTQQAFYYKAHMRYTVQLAEAVTLLQEATADSKAALDLASSSSAALRACSSGTDAKGTGSDDAPRKERKACAFDEDEDDDSC